MDAAAVDSFLRASETNLVSRSAVVALSIEASLSPSARALAAAASAPALRDAARSDCAAAHSLSACSKLCFSDFISE